ncbi:hypothetical protein [Turneriella parva]|uniref:Uncharacterized protein n=1 Tax=Turneriella parva (strain ATCC BAA-1111 / DSM 21527 / NCTC 11395 / H) TaxID=869212 RepID=I4B8V5_TURPD|nr:hypothetical protein [Turneriella parva]AFM13712.1 hypothetical protein Turpa_3073 [Turneriella parva DSM 21527]
MTESSAAARKKSRASGIAAIVSDDFTHLLRIEDLRRRKNLTPWIRRKNSVPVDVRIRFRANGEHPLAAAEFRPFIEAARRPGSPQSEVRIHGVAEKFVLHVGGEGLLSALAFDRSIIRLRSELKRIQQVLGSFRVTLVSDSMAELSELYRLKLATGITLQGERPLTRRTRFRREIRDVLVLTNISGSALPMLEHALPFWSKGVQGFRFRHVYGQLSQRRVESALEMREWQLVVYRGHGSVAGGKLCLNLSDGAYAMPQLNTALYVHSACLAQGENLSLHDLPAQNTLTPLEYLSDFDDASLMVVLLERYQATGSLPAAIRAVQQIYPQFVCLSTGP